MGNLQSLFSVNFQDLSNTFRFTMSKIIVNTIYCIVIIKYKILSLFSRYYYDFHNILLSDCDYDLRNHWNKAQYA